MSSPNILMSEMKATKAFRDKDYSLTLNSLNQALAFYNATNFDEYKTPEEFYTERRLQAKIIFVDFVINYFNKNSSSTVNTEKYLEKFDVLLDPDDLYVCADVYYYKSKVLYFLAKFKDRDNEFLNALVNDWEPSGLDLRTQISEMEEYFIEEYKDYKKDL